MACRAGGLTHVLKLRIKFAENFWLVKVVTKKRLNKRIWRRDTLLLVVLLPEQRRELLVRLRKQRLNQARVVERIERVALDDTPLERGQLPTTEDWIASRTEVGIEINPQFIDKTFREKVETIVREADEGAHALLGDKILKRRRRAPNNGRKADPRPQPKVEGNCVGCGCPHSKSTEGCRNCTARHGMRRNYAETANEKIDKIVSAHEESQKLVPRPVPVEVRAGAVPDNPVVKGMMVQGYEFVAHACPFCNGAVKISPAMRRTTCLECKEVLWPLEAPPLTNRTGGGPRAKVEVKPDVFDWLSILPPVPELPRKPGHWPRYA